MFIELTDHLRCVEDHEEGFVVLLPDEVAERSVRRGTLGCPACGRVYRIVDGVQEAGASPAIPARDDVPAGDALAALAGLAGPGGYVVLAGTSAGSTVALAAAAPGIHLVLVNPPEGVGEAPGTSLIRSSRLPLRSGSVRSVVLGAPFGDDPAWVDEAARVTLPGLRVVGRGARPVSAALDVLAEAEGWWVAQRVRR